MKPRQMLSLWAVCLCLLLAFSAINSTQARSALFHLRIGADTFGAHIPVDLFGKTVSIYRPENEHWWMFVEDILALFNKEKDILVTEAPIRNGVAMILTGRGGDTRLIVMDPNYQFGKGGLGAIAYRFVLAHEVGHHVCGHLSRNMNALPWNSELQADRFGGDAMKRWLKMHGGYDLSHLLTAVRMSLTARASATHPGVPDRLSAVTRGWNEGTDCT